MTAFKYGARFQDNMLSLMLRDIAFADKCLEYVPIDYLHSDSHKWIFERVRDTFSTTGTVPSKIEIEEAIRTTPKANRRSLRKFCDRIFDNDAESPEFIRDQLEDFSRRAQFADLFAHGQTLYNAGDHDDAYQYVLEQINQLHGISFRQQAAIDIADFDKLRRQHAAQVILGGGDVATLIPELDQILSGGLTKTEGEFGVIIAEAKVGKSIGLIHMGYAGLILGHKVAHFVLEGTTELTMMRYQSRFTRIPFNRIKKDELTPKEENRIEKISKRYAGLLKLVPMSDSWEYSTLDIEAKLKEFDRSGWRPDLVVIDYADLLKSRNEYRREDLEQRDVYRDIKSMAMQRRVAIWTASQAKRPREDVLHKVKTLGSAAVSESFEKIRVADLLVTLNQVPAEKTLGVMRLHVDRYRSNSASRTIHLATGFDRMILHNKVWGTVGQNLFPGTKK